MFSIPSSDLIIFIGLIFVGVILLMLIKAIIHFVIPLIGAIVVWYYTGSLTSAGIAFVIIALLELVFRRL